MVCGARRRTYFGRLMAHTRIRLSDNDDRVMLQTKSSEEAALALMIQGLEPIFSSKYQSHRRNGLHCLMGSLEAVESSSCGSSSSSSQIHLSYHVIQLLVNFLSPHCGPIAEEDGLEMDDEDFDEQVRDAALQCATPLVRLASRCNNDAQTSLPRLLPCDFCKTVYTIDVLIQIWMMIHSNGRSRTMIRVRALPTRTHGAQR